MRIHVTVMSHSFIHTFKRNAHPNTSLPPHISIPPRPLTRPHLSPPQDTPSSCRSVSSPPWWRNQWWCPPPWWRGAPRWGTTPPPPHTGTHSGWEEDEEMRRRWWEDDGEMMGRWWGDDGKMMGKWRWDWDEREVWMWMREDGCVRERWGDENEWEKEGKWVCGGFSMNVFAVGVNMWARIAVGGRESTGVSVPEWCLHVLHVHVHGGVLVRVLVELLHGHHTPPEHHRHPAGWLGGEGRERE